MNKTGTSKVSAISKAQKVPLGDIKKFSKQVSQSRKGARKVS